MYMFMESCAASRQHFMTFIRGKMTFPLKLMKANIPFVNYCQHLDG